MIRHVHSENFIMNSMSFHSKFYENFYESLSFAYYIWSQPKKKKDKKKKSLNYVTKLFGLETGMFYV